ncbi:PAS domain-containing protein [Aestuariispira insulae]|uniref:PAS domain-containing protein n=1 Tax=Aestuariispira insulae TaxID=1461337 RepID=A0A3D9HWM9_9PROT|nr:PAS domain-containing protein [Aestuariispira insulae]RED53887.1 PAS domain-containing protein [Aestuariispira insulae]
MLDLPFDDPILLGLHTYWSSKRDGQSLPTRADIDPADIPRLLPHIMLLEMRGQDQRFFVRLVGTKVAFGQDPTGTFMEESAPVGSYGSHIIALFRKAAETPHALYAEHEYGHPDQGASRVAKRLFMPLVNEAGTISMLLIGQRIIAPEFVQRSLWQLNPDQIQEVRMCEIP